MASLWKFGGLKPLQLGKLVVKKIGDDEISTRSAALSYYFLLALFPLLLFLVSLIGVFAGPGSELHNRIVSGLGRLAPGTATTLVRNVVNETLKSSAGWKLAVGLAGALWAASGGMSAVVESLDVVYQTPEERPWWKKRLLTIGLTLLLSALMLVAVVLVIYGEKLGPLVGSRIGLGQVFTWAWRILEWPVSFAAMFLAFAVIYYFGPDLKERKWYWVTPGGVTGVVLWLGASIGFRFYLKFFNSYSATYGSLGAVIILMLWLYITGFAVLIGAEVNWIIESQDKQPSELRRQAQEADREIKAA